MQSRAELICVELSADVVEPLVESTVSANCVELAFVGNVDELDLLSFAAVPLETSSTEISELDVDVVDTISSKLDVASFSVEAAFIL